MEPYSRNSVNHSVEREEDSAYDAADAIPRKAARIDQVSFAVVEMNLYLDTHPEDEDALAFFREKVELRKEALKQYAEQYDPLTIDTANDRMSRSFEWVMQPWPWEVNRKGGC